MLTLPISWTAQQHVEDVTPWPGLRSLTHASPSRCQTVNVRQLFNNLTLTPPPLYATVAQALPNHRSASVPQCDIGTAGCNSSTAHSAPLPRSSESVCMEAQVRLQLTDWKADLSQYRLEVGGQGCCGSEVHRVTRTGMLLFDDMGSAWETGKKSECL